MARRPHRLRTAILACLLAAGPFIVDIQAATPPEPAKLAVSRNASPELDTTLQQWFKEQDSLLDDILLRLTRIENLVRDIHGLVSRLPDFVAPQRAAPAASAPSTIQQAPPTPILVPSPVRRPTGVLGFFDQWGTLLATGGMLLLLLLMARRRRTPAAETTAAPSAVPPAPTFGRVATPPPAEKPVAMPRPSAPATAAQPEPKRPAPVSVMSEPASTGTPVEAGDQALELAEIMLSMGLGHGAAETLTEQIRKEPKQALRHWLRLLEVYRKNGQQEEFQRSAEELRLHFNVQPEDWQPRPEEQRSIADYPHIAARLTELWGKAGCLAYLQNLLDDNRGGARAGFPQSVAEELLLLSAMIKSGDIPG